MAEVDKKRLAIERRLRRLSGASMEHREILNDYNLQQSDWRTTCRFCGDTMKGTIDNIKEHYASCK